MERFNQICPLSIQRLWPNHPPTPSPAALPDVHNGAMAGEGPVSIGAMVSKDPAHGEVQTAANTGLQ